MDLNSYVPTLTAQEFFALFPDGKGVTVERCVVNATLWNFNYLAEQLLSDGAYATFINRKAIARARFRRRTYFLDKVSDQNLYVIAYRDYRIALAESFAQLFD